MKIVPAAHIEKMTGKFGDMVFIKRKSGTFARGKGRTCRHVSSQQQLMRQYLAAASSQWKQLDHQRRHAWNQYAREHFQSNNDGRPVTANGAAIFAKAAIVRQSLGLPINLDAPDQGRPDDIVSFTQIPGLDVYSLGLCILDMPKQPEAHMLAVRITRPLPDGSYEPTHRVYRYCCGLGPDSMKPFPGQGAEFRFTGLQWPIPTGSYFGLELHLVRPSDGIAGPAVAWVQMKE